LQSSFYLRKWFFDRLMDSSMDVLGPLYATLYLTPWYRLLGVHLGKAAEVSTACGVTPDLTQVDDESFIADAVCLGAPRVEAGIMTLATTRVGRRSFVGNSALVPAGATLGESTLVGVLSTTPLSRPGASEPDTSWLGSPAIYLPKRHVNTSFSQETTFKPTRKLIAQRLAIELARVLLPAALTVAIAAALLEVAGAIRPHLSLPSFLSLFPLLYLAGGIIGAMMVVAIKWLLMGRYRPDEKPLWSPFVWRTELVTAMHEHLADPLLIESLAGTPFICWFFRLMGCRIGRRVFMETTALTEFDLITVGDDVALNLDCTLQTHLFEDRVMKMSTVAIGAGCSVGAGSVVLYDSVMHPGSRLGDLSLLMKGETLPARTSWEGTPARPAGRAHPPRTTAPRPPESSRSFVHLITSEEVRGRAA
jgi:non-ribosomal peptide synthetase-like protein